MKKILYIDKNNFKFDLAKIKECEENEVEIMPLVLGLCGSDLHKFLNESPKKDYLLTNVLGHEICGIVTKVGKKVKKVEVGDRIVVNPFDIPNNAKLCESFSLYDENIKIVGRNIDGGYSEIVYLPENCIYRLPDNISNEDAIFIDDIAVALHGIHYISKYKTKTNFSNISVIGDGTLGILCYRILKIFFPACKVVLISKNSQNLKNLNIESIDYLEIDKYKETFDVVIEAVGGRQSDTINKAIMIGKNNCLILCYGVFHFNYMAKIDIRTLLYKQGVLKGINSYCNMFDDFNNAINILSNGKLYVNDLITKRVNFNESIDFIKNYPNTKNNIKTIFEVKK